MENKRKKQTKIYETVEKNLRRKLYLLYLYHNNNTLRAKLTNLLRVMDRKKLFWLPLENAILSCYVRVVVLFSNVRRSNMMTLQFSNVSRRKDMFYLSCLQYLMSPQTRLIMSSPLFCYLRGPL